GDPMHSSYLAEQDTLSSRSIAPTAAATPDTGDGQWQNFHIMRRNGAVVGFQPSKIAVAMTKAFLAVHGGQSAASARVRELVETLTGHVVGALVRNRPGGGTFHIEEVQEIGRAS